MGALRAEQDNSGEGRRRQGNVSAAHAEGEAALQHLPRAQPPAQQDGRPPVGHGARVTSRGRGTSFANPLGFGKLTQPCRELCPACSPRADCSGRAQVRLPPARLWLNLIISGADTRPALPRLAHASPGCSAPSPGLCSGCGAGCQHESAAPSLWSSPAGLGTRRLPKPLPPLPKAALGGGHGPVPQPPSPRCPLYPAPPIPSPLSHHQLPFWLQAEPGNPSLVPWGQRSLSLLGHREGSDQPFTLQHTIHPLL